MVDLQKFCVFILILYIVKEAFEYILLLLNLRHTKRFGAEVPQEFEGMVDENTLKKIQQYMFDKARAGFVSSIFGNVITILFIFGGLLNLYNSWIVSLDMSFIVSGLLFFLLLNYANTFLSLPFNLYSTFKIENRYGFNTITPKLWFTDFLKSLILSTVITGFLISSALWIIQTFPDLWWIWIWGFFLVFSIFIMYISPYVIEPLFNKFTPVEQEGLEEKIRNLMSKVNIRVSRVFKMDASKRSRHTNAYFSGIGRVKRIILYDTLLEKMNHSEILAVLAHEAGHWKKKHVMKMILMLEILSLIGIYIAFRVVQSNILPEVFRIEQPTFFAKILLIGFLASLGSFLFVPLGNYISRHFEKEADIFACELSGNKDAVASALIKLSKDNLSNLHPHPVYAAFYYSHPPVVQRIRTIKH